MKVGTICKLKVDCLGNKAGTLGVVFNDYGDGFQVIFENGHYDGFSTRLFRSADATEADRFLEEVGFEESLAGYQFKNVIKISLDYNKDLFDIAWSEKWKHIAEGFAPIEDCFLEAAPEYEKCKVYADSNRFVWLRFTRDTIPFELSSAMDFADFSHFEYADMGKSLYPRWMQAKKTIYPLYVVFRKQLIQERKCRKCGCTDLHACPGSCYWVEDDLCSECAPPGALGKTAGSTGMNGEAQS